jgi:hypothetical protein
MVTTYQPSSFSGIRNLSAIFLQNISTAFLRDNYLFINCMYLHKYKTHNHAILTLDTFMYDEACIQNLIGLGDSLQSYSTFYGLTFPKGDFYGVHTRILRQISKNCDIPIGISRGVLKMG